VRDANVNDVRIAWDSIIFVVEFDALVFEQLFKLLHSCSVVLRIVQCYVTNL